MITSIEELAVTPAHIAQAKAEARELGCLSYSITKGEGNTCGCLGEILIAERIHAKRVCSFDYDMLYEGWRIDTKTKRCTSPPQLHYLCSITNIHLQQCDYFVFVRILEDLSRAWVLGAIHRLAFMNQAVFYRKGDRDPDAIDDWCFREDCYNLPIRNLWPLKPKLST